MACMILNRTDFRRHAASGTPAPDGLDDQCTSEVFFSA